MEWSRIVFWHEKLSVRLRAEAKHIEDEQRKAELTARREYERNQQRGSQR
jgi:hypothetical protein